MKLKNSVFSSSRAHCLLTRLPATQRFCWSTRYEGLIRERAVQSISYCYRNGKVFAIFALLPSCCFFDTFLSNFHLGF